VRRRCGANCRLALLRKLPYLTWSRRERDTPSLLRVLVTSKGRYKDYHREPKGGGGYNDHQILTTYTRSRSNFPRPRPRRSAALHARRSLALPAKAWYR